MVELEIGSPLSVSFTPPLRSSPGPQMSLECAEAYTRREGLSFSHWGSFLGPQTGPVERGQP